MKSYFEDWFAYNREANAVLFPKLQTGIAAEKAIVLMGHILVAHRVWIDRMNPMRQSRVYGPWDSLEPNEFEAFNETLYRESVDFTTSADFDSIIEYSNSSGAVFRNSVGEILFHLMTHSAYHRGQVNLLLRQRDVEPVITDYIFYKRQGRL